MCVHRTAVFGLMSPLSKQVSKSLLFLIKREQCIRNGTSETRRETQIQKKQLYKPVLPAVP